MVEEEVAQVARLLAQAGVVVVLTGAGVSKESGIPTFREPDGFWSQYSLEDLATPQGFERDPAFVWQWYEWRREQIRQVSPNPGHLALAELEGLVQARGGEFALITQNIDGLHQRAGSQRVVELHGNIHFARPVGSPPDARHLLVELPPPPLGDLPPHLSQVEKRWKEMGRGDVLPPELARLSDREKGSLLLRPHVVWFGELLPQDAEREAYELSQRADLMLVVGTSAEVYPAALYPQISAARGGRMVEVNPAATALTPHAHYSLRGSAAKVLPALVEELRGQER